MDKKISIIVKNRRVFTALGTSGALLSSGLLAWQVYSVHQQQREISNLQQQLSTNRAMLEQHDDFSDVDKSNNILEQHDDLNYVDRSYNKLLDNETQYISVPQKVLDQINEYDQMKLSPVETKEDLKAIFPRHLRKQWRLLHQANTGDHEQHIKAVRELSRLSLSDGELCQLAQSCSSRTAVGLARTADVDMRFFMRPPPPPPDMRNREIVELFKEILTNLPSENQLDEIHDCIRYFTTTALEQYLTSSEEAVLDSDISCEFHRESHHMHSIPRPRVSQEMIVEHCLMALLSHSTVEDQCKILISTLTLPLFHLVISTFTENPRIKSIVGKIIANFSLNVENHELLFRSGWVGILAGWKQSPNLLVSLPATKALANMDQKYGRHKYQPGVYLLLPNDRQVQHLNQLSNWGVDVVFVHGLWGGVFYSWRQQDTDNVRELSENQISDDSYTFCWPRDWLAEDSAHVRVLGCDFDSYISQWVNNCPSQNFKQSLGERSEDLLEKLLDAGIGQTRPVIFVGHSMGGLIIKKMLVQAHNSGDSPALRRLVEKTKGVVFYSTPHFGSRIAKMNSLVKYFFFPSVEVQELEIDSPALLDLNTYFKEFVNKFGTKVISFGEAVPTRQLGIDLTFVPSNSSNPGVGDYYTVPFNHMDICKPGNKKSILFRKFYNLLWDLVDEEQPFN